MSTTFSKLSAATKPFYPSSINNLKEIAMCQIRQWSFKTSDQILIDAVLTEWLTAGTLEKALKQWENITTEESVTGQASLNIFCYNVQGWGSRSLEVTKIVFKIEAPIGVFTEFDELWNTSQAHDNTDKAFWLHLPTVYKRNSLPFTKLGTGNTVLSEEKEINEGLFRYYSEQFKAQNTDKSDPNEAQIEIKYQAKILTLNKLKEGIPRCEQTRPISLLAAYSKLFEKIVLERVRFWAESNKLLPEEQSGFRPGCLLPTRVLSIYKEIKNNMTANIPTAAIYVDYPKAYDIVSDKGLIVKLNRLNIFAGLLKLIISWLSDRYAYVVFGSSKSNAFPIHLGLPQGSNLSPYIFVVFHSDLVSCIGAHSSRVFADDLNVLITPPISRDFAPMLKFLEEGTRVCGNIADYSEKWKQPINFSKTVVQIFHSQVQVPVVNICMKSHQLLEVKEFKYLGFTWTNKMSLKPNIDKALENIQKTYC
ncbi:unnamed protein product [Rotaria socialis]|uniref:Reverse transcriptase domain-containing protein n=2 Tax=Rotaria socialis TaxID=392032 RepID=A0A821MLN3_9BILA|nr:unnamed protein product [Rotaria socialis]CAF3431239.1 unnamed protein product [Rotaria socialis]CAF4253087.1 unnamed protein product [Rotaria socialis]CAF4406226.1 unnamed protein product [Rotaria socialis]CAF4604423.1 unnamed protein product [Rotaria socialis]